MKVFWQKVRSLLRYWLVEPMPCVQAAEYNPRTARLLAGLLLVFTISSLLRLIYTLLHGQPSAATLSTVLIALPTYLLSRTRYYPHAAGMALFLLSLPSFLNAMDGPVYTEIEIRSHLSWLILPLVLGSIFLPVPGLALVAGLLIVEMACLPLLNPAISITAIYGSMGLVGTAVSLLLVMLRHHQRLETDRQAELNQREARYRALFEHTNDAIFILKMDGFYQEVNHQAANLLGYRAEEMVGMSNRQIVAADEVQDSQEKKAALLRGEILPLYERTFQHKDGHAVPVEVSVAIVSDVNGQPLHIQSIARDITERKRSERERERLIEKLEAQNTELERFTYTVSHDLKSPLVTIQGFLSFLEKDLAAGKNEQVQHDVTRIGSAIEKMRHLLDDLLMLSRAGRQMSTPAAVSFTTIAEVSIELVQGRLGERGVQVSIADDLPTLWGDRARMVQVLQNLLDNAIKFMGEQPQPQIFITSHPSDDRMLAHLCVQDNGSGITLENQQKIFGLFEKLDSQTEGTGIGLALVQRIIEAHGGRIWIESGGLNQGTAFHFTLPRPPGSQNQNQVLDTEPEKIKNG